MKTNVQTNVNKANELLSIRKAKIDDYKAVSDLLKLEIDTHIRVRPDYFKLLKSDYIEAEFKELLACPCPISWVAIQNENIVGICFGKIERTSENIFCKSRLVAFIQDVVVLPKYRGRGIATKLMTKARKQAINQGAVSMELCVWKFNVDAVLLYKKLGMQVQYYRMEESFI